MDRLFGELRPVPHERLVALGEVGEVDLGDGRSLAAFHNPGHASHHIGLLDSQHRRPLHGRRCRRVRAGDRRRPARHTPAGLRPRPDAVARSPACATAAPQRLLFSHFGPVDHVDDDPRPVGGRTALLGRGGRRPRGLIDPGLDHAVAMVREKDRERHPGFYADADRVSKFDELSSVEANVSGITRWLDARPTRPSCTRRRGLALLLDEGQSGSLVEPLGGVRDSRRRRTRRPCASTRARRGTARTLEQVRVGVLQAGPWRALR